MCQIRYITHKPCRCIHIHRPPTYCQFFLTAQQLAQKQLDSLFETKVITFHPALDGLLLFRDRKRFQSHTISAQIALEKFECVNTELALEVREVEDEALSCPLCVDNADVLRVMEDAANRCRGSRKAIEERMKETAARVQKAKKHEEKVLKIRKETQKKVQAELALKKERLLRKRRTKKAEREERRRSGGCHKEMRNGKVKLLFPKGVAAMDGTAHSGSTSNGFEDRFPGVERFDFGRSTLEDTFTGYANIRMAIARYPVTAPRDYVKADTTFAEKFNREKRQWQWNVSASKNIYGDLMKLEGEETGFESEVNDGGIIKWGSSPEHGSDCEMDWEAIGSIGGGPRCEEGDEGNELHLRREEAHNSDGGTRNFSDILPRLLASTADKEGEELSDEDDAADGGQDNSEAVLGSYREASMILREGQYRSLEE